MTAASTEETSSSVLEVPDGASSSVQVAVRVRPMLPHEAGNTQCIEVLKTSPTTTGCNIIRLGGETGPKFTFDQVFPLTTSQEHVYRNRVASLVANCLEGYNATILAYGQTGSGKTHTIMGPSASITSAVQDEQKAGVIPRAIREIFDKLTGYSEKESFSDDDVENDRKRSFDENDSHVYDVRVQFLEVYGQEIRDLLATTQDTNKKLSIRDVGMEEPEVVGASEVKVESAEEALLCLTRGMYRRVTGATAMNESSSRSHAIFSLIVEQSSVLDQIDGTPKKPRNAATDDDEMQHVQCKRSKFNFVDLAGSERQKRTQASGQRLKEGININQGLLVLGNVISALGDPKKQGKTFVPYRDSNLTRLLKGSLGGNHKTLMIACVSPSANNMEETLNCLRYANRAKNIQNHAVVNLDATSRLVAELRGKMQLLAADLLKAREGNVHSLSVPLEIVQSLAKGGDSDALTSQTPFATTPAQSNNYSPFMKENVLPSAARNIATELEYQQLKAENEVYKMKLDSLSNGEQSTADSLQTAFITRAAEYENEIALLRAQVNAMGSGPIFERGGNPDGDDRNRIPGLPPRTPGRRSTTRPESPELSRLRAQMFGSMAQEKNLDAEVEAEERAVVELTSRYLGNKQLDEEDELDAPDSIIPEGEEDPHALLEAEMFELSHSINAKEELIQKLQSSQKKYEAMREFYEEKLREMAVLLAEKEQETEKLSDELSKLDKDHNQKQELADRLKLKQQQVADLKRKQAELTRLTTVASKNESQISKLANEVSDMKHKKVELQKQLAAERKIHATEVQKLKKESMQQQRELNKMKQQKEKKTQEAEKAQQVAKARLDQVMQLKSKYKESEKRLRILTVKRGVMTRAGLDPVMVGRRQSKVGAQHSKHQKQAASDQATEDEVNIDGLRDFFDQKVAEVGRREALAEKLAQEWEEHLNLSSQMEELEQKGLDDDKESIEALDSRIKYKEERIRQLAARLGKPRKDREEEVESADTFMFSRELKQHVGNVSPMASATIAAKVLFGMVVRERRRIAALARTASALDEKVQEAEAAVAAKDSAFRAYVDEQRLEAAELAQNQQQHILSLMDMVREQPEDGDADSSLSSPVRSAKARHAEKANSKLLLLANERIAVLERQLNETRLGREAIQKHRERESDALAELEEKTRECEDLEEELNDLRIAMRKIRDEINVEEDAADDHIDNHSRRTKSILDIVVQSLHPKLVPSDSSSKRRRRSSTSKSTASSPALAIRRQSGGFLNTSDSDDVPDWADDIMKDLEVIAKGEIPSSLMDSPTVADAEAQFENQNVFERLNNPKSFTGVQKQKKKGASQNSRKGKASEPVSDGQRHRKIMSKQIANSLDKLVVPHAPQVPDDEGKNRSVFDRLLSPSNLTGTQKQRFQDKKGKREAERCSGEHRRSGEEKQASQGRTDGETVDDILHSVSDEGTEPKNKVAKSESTRKREEYIHSDVFERLNKTTTQAYAVKQQVNIAEKMLDDLLDESQSQSEETSYPAKAELHTNRVDAYTQQNVFERLVKTTTHAYAVKHNNGLAEKKSEHLQDRREHNECSIEGNASALSIHQLDAAAKEKAESNGSSSQNADKMLDEILDASISSNGESSNDPFSPIITRLRSRRKQESRDVFERLQQTTTEAFDKKKSSQVEQ